MRQFVSIVIGTSQLRACGMPGRHLDLQQCCDMGKTMSLETKAKELGDLPSVVSSGGLCYSVHASTLNHVTSIGGTPPLQGGLGGT